MMMQRIAGVLDECIQKVESVCLLPALLADLESRSAALGDELAVALQEHRRLSERMAVRSPNQPKTESEERKALEQEFQSSLRDVLQQLQSSPAAGQALQSWRLCESSQQLVQGLKELQGVLLEKLLTSPEEERDRSRYTQEVILRDRDNTKLVSALDTEVAAAVKDRDIKITKKNEVIHKFKSSLQQMEKLCEDFVLSTQQEAEKQGQSDRRASESQQKHLLEELSGLRTQLNNLLVANHEVEVALRKRKYKVETEIENWIQKYDADMGEKQSELEELSTAYAEEQEELRELEERYTILEVEYTQIVEEKRLAKERKEREERELAMKTCASVIIQAYWRGYKVRKALRAKAKKGKKGKGKRGK